MELPILTLGKEKTGTRKMPNQFSEPVRPDIIKRAALAIQRKRRQPYGSDPLAGQKASAKLSRRRRDYKASYGLGISRVPRKTLSRRGTRMSWVGAEAPGTVGGRRAHPPKPIKIWEVKINEKERKKAIRSCLAATISKEWATSAPQEYPFLLDDKTEEVANTKLLAQGLRGFGLLKTGREKIRSGKGKLRGRRKKQRRGILIVVSKECPMIRAANNLPGVETALVRSLNADTLAPGTHPGRLTLYTKASVDILEKEKLFE